MNLNQAGSTAVNVVATVGKLALRFMRIGATRTAIYTLMESEREATKEVTGQFATGYQERVKPHVRHQVNKFKIIKGGKA